MAEELEQLEEKLWAAADKLRSESGLKSTQYSTPLLGLIFLRFTSNKYEKFKDEIEAEFAASQDTSNLKEREEIALSKVGFYLPEEYRFDYLLSLSGQEDIPRKIKEAMKELEIFDILRKDNLSKSEELKVKSAAKNLLEKLKSNQKQFFTTDWYKDSSKKKSFELFVRDTLNITLLESYDRITFQEKNSLLCNCLIVRAARNGGYLFAS